MNTHTHRHFSANNELILPLLHTTGLKETGLLAHFWLTDSFRRVCVQREDSFHTILNCAQYQTLQERQVNKDRKKKKPRRTDVHLTTETRTFAVHIKSLLMCFRSERWKWLSSKTTPAYRSRARYAGIWRVVVYVYWLGGYERQSAVEKKRQSGFEGRSVTWVTYCQAEIRY